MADDGEGDHFAPFVVAEDKGCAVAAVHDAEDVEVMNVAFSAFVSFGHFVDVYGDVASHDFGDVTLFGAPVGAIEGDGVSGILNITVSGSGFSVNSFNKDVTRFTPGGDFLQYVDTQLPTPPANPVGTTLMSGTINGTSMTFNPQGRLGSFNSPLLLDRLWAVDDCTLIGTSCDPVPNGNTAWDVMTTGSASNTKGTINGTPLASAGDLNGDGLDDFTATLVSGGTMGSSWGGFFGAQYFEVWNVSLLSVEAPVPVPAAIWLFGSGLLGLAGISRRKKTT